MTSITRLHFACLFTLATTPHATAQVFGIPPWQQIGIPGPLFLTPYLSNETLRYEALLYSRIRVFPTVTAHSGYFTVNATTNNSLFFLFLKADARNDTKAPIILSLKGGPGITSLFGMFLETGPFGFYPNGLRLTRRHSLQKDMNLLYVDLPAGSGYSMVNPGGYATRLEDVSGDVDEFFIQFFTLFPEYSRTPLYITGEHYGGRLAVSIGNHLLDKSYVNFKGIIVGNTFLGRLIDVIDPSDFLYSAKMIGEEERNALESYFDKAEDLIDAGRQEDAWYLLRSAVAIGGRHPWRTAFQNLTGYEWQSSVLYDLKPAEFRAFLTQIKSTLFKKAIHVGEKTVPHGTRDEVVKSLVPNDFNRDITEDLIDLIRAEKTVTFYVGQLNTLLTAENLESYVQSSLIENKMGGLGERVPWYNTDSWHRMGIAGYVRNNGHFNFVVLVRAGQHAAFDESRNYCELVRRVVFNGSLF